MLDSLLAVSWLYPCRVYPWSLVVYPVHFVVLSEDISYLILPVHKMEIMNTLCANQTKVANASELVCSQKISLTRPLTQFESTAPQYIHVQLYP